MNPLVKVALSFGILLTAELISFITGQLSEKERNEQNKLEQEILCKQSKNDQKLEKIREELKEQFGDELNQRYNDELNRQRQLLKADSKEDITNFLSKMAEDRFDYMNQTVLPEINNSINILREQKKRYNTSIRKNAYTLLYSELKSTEAKAKAYIIYLKRYIGYVGKIYDFSDDLKKIMFSYFLPENFPCQDTVIKINSNYVDMQTGYGTMFFHGCMNIDFYIEDHDQYINEPCNTYYAAMTGFDKNNYKYLYSVQLGRYKQIQQSGGFTGVEATVSGYTTYEVILTYGKDMKLTLNARNLRNFNRYPAIGANIVVYPLKEFYSKEEERIIYPVSERQEDTEIFLDFKRIPLILPNEKAGEFLQYFEKYDLNFDGETDVKIVPLEESEKYLLSPSIFKLHFGNRFSITVEICSENEKQFLRYLEFSAETASISADKIFIPFSAELDIVVENQAVQLSTPEYSDLFDNMNNLIMIITREFSAQNRLKNSQSGIKYFNAWGNVTSTLRKYIEKGNSISCSVSSLPDRKSSSIKYKDKNIVKGVMLTFVVDDVNALRRYYEKVTSEYEQFHAFPEFFMEYEKTYYTVEISATCETFCVMVPYSMESLEKNDDLVYEISQQPEIIIYLRNKGVPELRQLQALYNFRIGWMINEVFQTYLLDSRCIFPSMSDITDLTLYNSSLSDNASQLDSLKRSLYEKNLFLIQGPPGTGKTTVIRELIAQTICHNPDSKILVVSQANVAVDNVLKGLIRRGMPFSQDKIIRCGRSGKISSEISGISFEKKYKYYISSIQDMANKANDPTILRLAKEWLSRINLNIGYDPDVGELVLRNHQIIGATCVGLSQKRIGLDKICFDLVIIDEAGKALAPEILIPLIQAKKAVIIGDHKQLPPVIDPALYDAEKTELDERQYCKQELFDTSYFQRLFENCPDSNKSTLDTQYRMPSVIGTMISNLFYDGKLKNGIGTEAKRPIYGDSNLCLIDMSNINAYREDETGSPTNKYEAEYVIHLIQKIQQMHLKSKIAVITPYKGQKKLIRDLFINIGIDYRENNVFVDTVDSFQGDEADIVIFCTTRCIKRTQFLSDRRRLNVAISRTRCEFIMLASVSYLESYREKEPIHMILDYIRKHGIIRKPDEIEVHNRLMNKTVIDISKAFLDSMTENSEKRITDIKDEIEYYNEHGHFSGYPDVYLEDGLYVINNRQEIYYAALSLSLSEIWVNIISPEKHILTFTDKVKVQ